jgi:hypothetical protein
MIKEEDEAGLDLDWFAIDAQGAIAHFTTGGCGALPRSVAASRDDLETVRTYLLALPETTAALVNPNRVASIPLFPSIRTEPATNLRPWTATAARGMYAYDYIEDRKRRPRPYLLVARPELPLKADELPPAIRAILEETVLKNVIFASHDLIGLASLL